MSARPHLLSEASAATIAARIRSIDERTGARVVAALVRRSDHFHGLRWRAFALGAALAALCGVLYAWWHPQWNTGYTVLFNAVVILGAGLTLAVIATFVPPFERLFLQRPRAEAEVRQRAKTLFLERELFATPGRNAVLLLAGEFEEAVALYADRHYSGRVSGAEWNAVVAAMTPLFRRHDYLPAFVAGLDALEALLVAKGMHPQPGDGAVAADPLIQIQDDRA
jgi:putative membrane protein